MRWSSVAPPEVFCKDFVDISYGNVFHWGKWNYYMIAAYLVLFGLWNVFFRLMRTLEFTRVIKNLFSAVFIA